MAGYFGTKAEGEPQEGDGKEDEKKGEEGGGQTGRAAQYSGEMTVEGELCFTFSARGKTEAEAHEEYLRQLDRLGYKIGLRLRREQDIRAFLFRREREDVRMREDHAVTDDLTEVLGAAPDEKWIGFLPDSRERRSSEFPEPNVVCYRFVLSLAPRPRLPLLIPIVIRHDNGRSFRESFIGGLLTIRARRAG